MKKIIGYISIVLLALLTLTSCSNKNINKLYDNLGKDTIYKLVTPEEFKEIRTKETDKMVYLLYANHKDFASKDAVLTIQEQAKQYQVEVIYYIDSAEFDSVAKRNEVKSLIGIHDAAITPTLLAYNCPNDDVDNPKYTFDSSIVEFSRHFKNNEGKLDFVRLSGFVFRDNCNKAELPKI